MNELFSPAGLALQVLCSEDADDGIELATLDYNKPSALDIEPNSSKAIAGKESSLSSWCIASLCIYHFPIVFDFSSEKYSGSTGHRNSCL